MNGLQQIREKMPWVASILEDLGNHFGAEAIEDMVNRGFAGEPTFYAVENGVRVGTRNTVHTSVIEWDEFGIARSRDADWLVEAREFARRRGISIRQYDPGKPGDIEREARELRDMIAKAKANRK